MKHILPNLIFFKKKGAEDAIGCTKDFLAQLDLTEVDRPISKKLILKKVCVINCCQGAGEDMFIGKSTNNDKLK